MVRSGSLFPRFFRLAAALAGLCGTWSPGWAYTPGAGSLASFNFEGALDADWEVGNGSSASPWTQVPDGGDTSFYADGRGPVAFSPTLHWARHFVTPVTATAFSAAFEYRAELGTGYGFTFDIEQRSPVPRKYRLHVDHQGVVSLWRTENGSFVKRANTSGPVIPVNQKRWIRLAAEPGAGGHPRVLARVWSGGAAAEPAGWTLEFTDELDTLARVHRFELTADGPKDIETWIDDLDAWGDQGTGIPSTITTIYLVEWSHLDIGFTEPPDDIEAFAKSHLDQVLDNMDADPAYHWTIEESYFLKHWWDRSSAAERQELVGRLQSGRMSLAAAWATLHSTTAAQEELTRALYYASRFAREHQVPLRTWISDDVPGTTFALPEILARSGLEFFIGGMNTSFGGRVNHPHHGERPFWWVGPDGSRVLSWITFDSYAEAFDYGFSFFDNLPDLYKKLGKKLPEQEEAGYKYPEFMLLRAFDNHYQGFKARDLINQWNAAYQTPHFVLATPEQFFDHMLATYDPATFPSFNKDFGAAWSNSHAAAQHTEEWVRQAHRNGLAAEAFLALGCAIDGAPVPQGSIDLMYQRMLDVDEHSGAGGWEKYFTPEEMDRNNRLHLGYAVEARDLAAQSLEEGVSRVVQQIPAAGNAVAVLNSQGRARDAWARLALPAGLFDSAFRVVDRATGAEAPFQRFAATREILFRASALPAFGYKVFDLLPGDPSAIPSGYLAATATVLENDFYRLEVNTSDGSLSSVIEKATGRQLVDPGSAYHFNRLASSTSQAALANSPPAVENLGSATVTLLTAGPLVAQVKVSRTQTPHVETTYRLYRGEDRVEIENVLNRNKMPYVPYSVGWRAYYVTLPFNVHNFDLRTETATRFLDPFTGDSFDRPDYSDWHNVEHVMAFWDTGGGIYYSCDAIDVHHFETLSSLTSGQWSRGSALVLSRMYDRSDEYIFADETTGPFVMEPDTSPIFRFTTSFRGTPAGFDPVAASRFGREALVPAAARLLTAQGGGLPGDQAGFFAVDTPAVLPSTLKKADDGQGLILRLQELTGQPATARLSSSVFEMEGPLLVQHDEEGGTPLAMEEGVVVVPLTPYQIATVRLQAALPAGPIQLTVTRNNALQAVHLAWTGGRAPFTVIRAENPQFTSGVVTLVDEQNVTSFDDPVLEDGKTYYYRVE